ncbi:3-keto-L-gulonate-6-phosphate decarboxylase [Spiroplasma eriocheiris]|uniref:3-keto-L-gulonate-6-phosphate decarboxylase n=1 Tax=Spiroplasma eriocheiris TaxID=315358 RepID=A0A0H3XIS6_9MOLU|nr:3-keto-L-gulonate-6-phosphate decarboxylase UlaD [Spiroplasma eriocheiris]AKM54395.1 3-keto-L-gulonate-6-phosphate decarboxylase [Spiroplasma eriocheiris]
MKKPLLQIALDTLTLQEALDNLALVAPEVDIIEIGTILLCAEGISAIKTIKKHYPNKIILADGKIADAGKILGGMLLAAGADIITVICCADLATIASVVEISKEYHKEMQIELTGVWTFEQAQKWKNLGVEQVVYHRARDAQAAGAKWTTEDFQKIEQLINLGFKVTITGGIEPNDLDLFSKYPIYIIIAGRAIRDHNDPHQAAITFQKLLQTKWEN